MILIFAKVLTVHCLQYLKKARTKFTKVFFPNSLFSKVAGVSLEQSSI